MTQSMTAFAREEQKTPYGVLLCELRSVNHRYLEIACRLPEELRPAEMKLRERIGEVLSRGKVDCSFRFQDRGQVQGDLEINPEILKALLNASAQIAQQGGSIQSLRAIDVLRWPGLLQAPDIDADVLQQEALNLLSNTLQSLQQTRGREGRRLTELIQKRLQGIQDIVAEVRKVLPEATENREQRLRERLSVVQAELEPGRLEQEMVIFAQKSDVDEELDRLQGHITETEDALKRKEPIGRRLDFLLQEFNREANTLASKSVDIRITNAAVELKVLIEQMREQVQNIE